MCPISSMRLVSVFAILIASGAVACSGGDRDDQELGVAEGEKRIKISDSENLGEIQVGLPTGWPANQTGFIGLGTGFSVQYRDSELKLGVPERVTGGTGCVQLRGAFAGAMEACKVTVAKSFRTTFDLAALQMGWDPNSAQSTLRVDFGPVPSFTLKRLAQTTGEPDRVIVGPGNVGYNHYGQPIISALGALVLPGKYELDYGVGAALKPLSVSLSQGQYKKVSTMPADKRAKLVVKPPVRELPNPARPGACVGQATNFVIMRDNSAGPSQLRPEPDLKDFRYGAGLGQASSYGIRQFYSMDGTTPIELVMFPLSATDDTMHYEVVANNVMMPITLKAGQTKTVQLERLDVDDVDVTKEDGTTYSVKGYYYVERDDNGTWVPVMTQMTESYGSCVDSGSATPFGATTGTGLDVLPGNYRVTIHYSTAEGQKTSVQTVSLP